MSVSTIKTIMGRIESAEPDSPIAVFMTPAGMLNAVFANTVKSQFLIDSNANFIGVYDNTMNLKFVNEELREMQALVA